jgi:hypothetical protein
MNSIDQDKALIESLGGPAKLAETLGYEKEGGVQRVQNWLSRGIPPAVKLQRPDLFLRDLKATSNHTNKRDAPHREGPSNRKGR